MVAFASTQASECINSRDPIGEAGGANLYAYAENDPINKRDLWGLRPSRLEEYESVFDIIFEFPPFHVVGDEEPPSDEVVELGPVEARAVPAFDDMFDTTEGSPIDDNRSSAESTAFSDSGGSGGGSGSGTEGSSDGSEEEEEKAERNEKSQGEESTYSGEPGETFSYKITNRITSQEQADAYQLGDGTMSVAKVTVVSLASGGIVGASEATAATASTVSTVIGVGGSVAEVLSSHRYNTGDIIVQNIVMTRTETDFGVQVNRSVTIYREGLAPDLIESSTPMNGSMSNSMDREGFRAFINAPLMRYSDKD